MEESNSASQAAATTDTASEQEPAVKWDYTSNKQNLFTGGLVVGGNLLLIIVYLLYRTVPSVHEFISGKPL